MSSMKHVVRPGSTIGMLGGGQLGRMFAIAARQCGYGVQIFGDVVFDASFGEFG